MGLFRRTRASNQAATVLPEVTAAPATVTPTLGEPGHDESDVFVCKHDESTPAPERERPRDDLADANVTLFVTGWHNVEPGPLSWPFPNMRAALDAVRKMRNAVEWSIALGREHASIDDARESGAILIEQRG